MRSTLASAQGWRTRGLLDGLKRSDMRGWCWAQFWAQNGVVQAATAPHSLGSPGIDNLRWTKPVFPGDTLRVKLEVLDARPMASKPHVGLTRSRWEVRNQRDEPVLTMEGWGMFRRRAAAVGENLS